MTTKIESLVLAEEITRQAGFDLPIAWALGFISQHKGIISDSLKAEGYYSFADEVEAIGDWIRNGKEQHD